ncbi:unnamed protein product [Cylicostephanus goldi]|uniref:EGF-like domain-containing protein n=1 Tax=Cylicostephanus goldi TaxID=71465 RepID=A0A3P6PSL8_CYLGO|nr:unnamed protein product [Cylicostephanus goldi]
MADGKCKCRPGFEGDGIENCTQIATSSPSISESTTPSTITSAISASESSTTPKGSVVGTGEREVTELTTVATTTPAESFAPTSRHGKDGTGTSLITEFQGSSTSEPTSITSPHPHIESTLSTTLDSSSNLTTETTLIHEKSTTHAAEITGIDRIVTILTSGVNVTDDNTTDTTSKQLHSTLSVDTNQPMDNLTIYTTERPYITPILIEVTNSLVVLQPGTLRPDEVITGVSSKHEIPIGKSGVVTSGVLHRGTTLSTSESPSTVMGSTTDFPEDLGVTGRGSIVQVTGKISKNETRVPPIRGSTVTSLPVTLSSTSTSPSGETPTSLSTLSAETRTPPEDEVTSSTESDHATDEVTTEGVEIVTLPSTDTTDTSVQSTLSEILKDSSTQSTTSKKVASLETLKTSGSTTKAPEGLALHPSTQTSNKTTEKVLGSTLPGHISPTPKPIDAKKTTISSDRKNFTYGTTDDGIDHEKTDAFLLSTATTAFNPTEEASGSDVPLRTTTESTTLTSEKSYSSMIPSNRSSLSDRDTDGEQGRSSLTPRISSEDFGAESSGEPELTVAGSKITLSTTHSSADVSGEEFIGNGTTMHPHAAIVTATDITGEVNVPEEVVAGQRTSAEGTESTRSAILGSTEPTSRKSTTSGKLEPASATSAPAKSTKQSQPSSRRPLTTFKPAPEGLRSTDEPSFTITEDTAYPKGKGATRSGMEKFSTSTISSTSSATHYTTSAEGAEILSTPEGTGADVVSTAETSSSQGHTSSPTSSDVTSVTAKPWTPSTTQASKVLKPSTSSSKAIEETTESSMTAEEGTETEPRSSVTSEGATERPKATKPWIITGIPISEEVLSSDRPRPSHATKPWIITGAPTSEEFLSTDMPSSKTLRPRVELVTASIEGSGTSDSSWPKRPGFARKPYTSASEESTMSTTTIIEASGTSPWDEEMTTISSREEILTSAENLTTSGEVTDLSGRRVTLGSVNITKTDKENLEGITEVSSGTRSTARTQPKKQTEDSVRASTVSSQNLTINKEHITHSAATNESSSEADFTARTGSTKAPTSDSHTLSSDRHQTIDHFEQNASTITAITDGVTHDINVVTLSTVEGISSSRTHKRMSAALYLSIHF